MLSVAHVTPHLGGGIGSVVLKWLEKDTSCHIHTVISLDQNNNSEWKTVDSKFKNITIFDNCYTNTGFHSFLNEQIEQADLLIVHWWNHPLLYDVLVNFSFPVCRFVAWNHSAGLYPPYTIPARMIDFSDMFVHTSPVSYEAKEIILLSASQKKKMTHIWSTTDLSKYEEVMRVPQKKFTIGFIGTVDFAKLHPQFVRMCLNVSRKNIQFVVCSEDAQKHLVDQVNKMGGMGKILFRGKGDPIKELPQYDVFGYPLQPNHFGTCEQALGEAMMAGCVPVVLNNPAERQIVEHMRTGIIANSPEEYSSAIEYLYDNPDLFKTLSVNARTAAKEKYDLKKTIAQWNDLFTEVMKLPKRKRAWDEVEQKKSPAHLYAESLGEYGRPLHAYLSARTDQEKAEAMQRIRELFQSNLMFTSKSKGSVLQYLQFFPNDQVLQEWATLLNSI